MNIRYPIYEGVYRILTMEHGQEAHTQPAGRTHGHGAYRHLPFKGGIRDDLPVRPWMDNNGWQPHRQYIFP